MKIKSIERRLDHTLLNPTVSREEIKAFCEAARGSEIASVCIPPRYIQEAVSILNEEIPICTVVGFPNGYASTATKVYEAKEALFLGATEIDAVIAIGEIKVQDAEYILNEVEILRQETLGSTLKIIIESGALTDREIVYISQLLKDSGIDYLKTSTGFNFPGAAGHNVQLMKKTVGDGIKIKASGGISSLEQAQYFINLGVERIGSSRLLQVCREYDETIK